MSASPSWAAIAAGAIGLAVLDGVVSRSGAVSNVGGWIAGTGKAVQWFLSPAVPAFKNATPAQNIPPGVASGAGGIASGGNLPAGNTVTPPGSSAASQPNGSRLPGVTNPSQQTVLQGGAV